MVPSYRGVPCFFWWVTGLVQSFVPLAKPMKLATPMGALSGKSVQVSLPAVVSITAVGWAAAAPKDAPENAKFNITAAVKTKQTLRMNSSSVGLSRAAGNEPVGQNCLSKNELYDNQRDSAFSRTRPH